MHPHSSIPFGPPSPIAHAQLQLRQALTSPAAADSRLQTATWQRHEEQGQSGSVPVVVKTLDGIAYAASHEDALAAEVVTHSMLAPLRSFGATCPCRAAEALVAPAPATPLILSSPLL
jgi:hypothetical protein